MESSAGVPRGPVMGLVLMAFGVMTAMAPGASAAADLVTLEKATFGPFGGKAFVVCNSEGSWHRAMRHLENAGALSILPAPDPPTDVDWAREVVLVLAAGSTGYDGELILSPAGRGTVKLEPKWISLRPPPVDCDHDGDIDEFDTCQPVYVEFLPYHLCKLPKHLWLQDLTVQDAEVDAILPLIGSEDSPPILVTTWGEVKTLYR